MNFWIKALRPKVFEITNEMCVCKSTINYSDVNSGQKFYTSSVTSSWFNVFVLSDIN